MIEIIEADSLSNRRRIATAETFEEAMTMVENMGAAFWEEDADYVDCADAFLKDGRIISVQPVGFSLDDEKFWAGGKTA